MQVVIGCLSSDNKFLSKLRKDLKRTTFSKEPLIVLSNKKTRRLKPRNNFFYFRLKEADDILYKMLKANKIQKNKEICVTAFGFGKHKRKLGQLRNTLGFLCLHVINLLGYNIKESVVVFIDDDVVPTSNSISGLLQPIEERFADITTGSYKGKPPYPVPHPRNRAWAENTRLLKDLLANMSNTHADIKTKDIMFKQLFANSGKADCNNCNLSRMSFKVNSYCAGNSARKAEILLKVPCETNLNRKGDDIIPGLLLSYASPKRIYSACLAKARHKFTRIMPLNKSLVTMLYANDFENLIIELLKKYRSVIDKDTLYYPSNFGKWFLKNKVALEDNELIMSRIEFYKKYIDAINAFCNYFHKKVSIPQLKVIVHTNNKWLIEYATLLVEYNELMYTFFKVKTNMAVG